MYYVYQIAVNGTVRYIGKGKKHRYKVHEQTARRAKQGVA